MMRLNRYLAKCGVASRRRAEDLILAGRVKVNGVVVNQLGSRIDENTDRIECDDEPLLPPRKTTTILLHKPAQSISSTTDPFRRRTINDLIPDIPGVVPVGRLDWETEGLILLSNDGELVHRLAHPRYEIEKRYLVRVDRALTSACADSLEKGVEIGLSRPARADAVEIVNETTLRLSLHEGKNRQIRRMLSALGYEVIYLKRERYAFLGCDDLEVGHWRYLTDDEVDRLRRAVRLG